MIKCLNCGVKIKTFNKRRKWCLECRRKLAIKREKERKGVKKFRSVPTISSDILMK